VSLENGGDYRKILEDYSLEMIDQMLNISAATAIMAYSLYTFAGFSKTGSQHPLMMLTIPFVVYGIFRYLYLIHSRKIVGSPEPEYVLLSDKPMILTALLWAATAMAVLRFG
jgi:4-hydroxybenzoate polyprenyltransferase